MYRVVLAREIDKIFFEKENSKRTHQWVYDHYTCSLGMSYDTFLSYLNPKKHQTSDVELPKEVQDVLEFLREVKRKMKK